jgi:acid stress-induced BolA-like protein IbaG/YrbA
MWLPHAARRYLRYPTGAMSELTEKITAALRDLDLENATIDARGVDRSIFATVVSSSFAGMDEAERQRMVWRALREHLTDQERVVVEFVFTVAPGEEEAVDEAV